MTHITFYRKYRSQTFDEIMGQSHIVQTLKNAIEHDRLGHAYIFSGPRGTGKTSIARIFAKTLNCTPGKSIQDCDICDHITKGNCVDVIEMDAASNTGVDHIRVLNEQVKFAPVECKYKLFIIDEAHMLSSGAFNALLKTMEEPPENTIFILATTEPQKIPVTIHSRCQHLQFKKLSTQEIVTQLQHIVTTEGISIPEKGLHMIARQSSGCMRDGISLLDQIYSFKGKEITQDDIIEILGSAGFDHLVTLMTVFFKRDVDQTMAQLQGVFDDGANIVQLIQDMTHFIKLALFAKLNLDKNIDLDESRISTLKSLASLIDAETLKTLLEDFAKVEMDLRWFPNPQLLLQIRFLHFIENTVEEPRVTAQIETLSKSKPAEVTQTAQSDDVSKSATTPVKQTPKPAPLPQLPNEVVPKKPEPIDVKPVGGVKILTKVSHEAVASPTVQQHQTKTELGHKQESKSFVGDIGTQLKNLSNLNEASSTAKVNDTAPAVEITEFHTRLFERFLDYVKQHNAALFFIISGAKLQHISDDSFTMILKQNFKFTREKLKESANRSFLDKAVQATFNKPMGINVGDDVILSKPSTEPSSSEAPGDSQLGDHVSNTSGNGMTSQSVQAPAEPLSENDNLESKKINTIISLFDGEVIE